MVSQYSWMQYFWPAPLIICGAFLITACVGSSNGQRFGGGLRVDGAKKVQVAVLLPIGAKVVTKKQAFASAVVNEMEKREALKDKKEKKTKSIDQIEEVETKRVEEVEAKKIEEVETKKIEE